MVFTEEDCVVIKFLRQNKGYSARRFVKEFPLKNWKIGGLNELLKKSIDTGSTLGCPAAVGEEPPELSDENVECVRDIRSSNFIITQNS